MTESPEQMTRRILAELYPPPSPLSEAMRQLGEAMQKAGRALYEMTAALRLTPTEPCRLCGCWGGHHDGCPLGERC